MEVVQNVAAKLEWVLGSGRSKRVQNTPTHRPVRKITPLKQSAQSVSSEMVKTSISFPPSFFIRIIKNAASYQKTTLNTLLVSLLTLRRLHRIAESAAEVHQPPGHHVTSWVARSRRAVTCLCGSACMFARSGSPFFFFLN